MGRRKKTEAMSPEELRAQMTRGLRLRETVSTYDALGAKLAARGEWDILSMRDVREICLLTEAIIEYHSQSAASIKRGDLRSAKIYLQMCQAAESGRGAILERWNLLPRKLRGRPKLETPEDLREAAQDDGWDTFGMDADAEEDE